MKARWHAAAKEVAYKFFDLRKGKIERLYSVFEKGEVHIKVQYKFDPHLEPKCMDKNLFGHLRTSRAVWKNTLGKAWIVLKTQQLSCGGMDKINRMVAC